MSEGEVVAAGPENPDFCIRTFHHKAGRSTLLLGQIIFNEATQFAFYQDCSQRVVRSI